MSPAEVSTRGPTPADPTPSRIMGLRSSTRGPSNMNAEIEEIIRKNLPAHVSDTLKSELEDLCEIRKLLPRQTETIESQQKVINNLRAEVRRLSDQLNGHKSLDERSAALDQRERELTLTILQAKLDCEKEKAQLATTLALSLTRDVEYRQHVFGSTTQQSTHPSAYQGQTVIAPYNHEKKEIVE